MLFINSYLRDLSRTFRMVQEVQRTVFRHGLAFYGTVAFVASFLGARLFATPNPTVTVVRGGIHFHHFWYGLAMVISAGWLGITLNNERMGRNLAIVFGLGAGLIGDEVGLLLTFGDYTSNLTEIFFVAAVGFIILAGRTQNTDYSSFGIVLLKAETMEAAREIMLNDPAVKNKVFRAELFPYKTSLFNPNNAK